ncbi:MAG TPA: hypothetical protein VKE40_23465 [Gemmataceae bacterium]|nr:hypothetical protein [Gemmataceae bacterium]
MSKSTGPDRRRTSLIWSGVFAANLVVPLFLGLQATSSGGATGMACAILVCWVAGLAFCVQGGRLGSVLIRGGRRVALCQFLLMPHIAAGFFALWFWTDMIDQPPLPKGGPWAEMGGFVVTLLTALPLVIAAILFGGGARLLSDPPGADESADYAEPSRDETPTPRDTAYPPSASFFFEGG